MPRVIIFTSVVISEAHAELREILSEERRSVADSVDTELRRRADHLISASLAEPHTLSCPRASEICADVTRDAIVGVAHRVLHTRLPGQSDARRHAIITRASDHDFSCIAGALSP